MGDKRGDFSRGKCADNTSSSSFGTISIPAAALTGLYSSSIVAFALVVVIVVVGMSDKTIRRGIRSIFSKMNLNIGILGHVDAGKTTLGARLKTTATLSNNNSKGVERDGVNSGV